MKKSKIVSLVLITAALASVEKAAAQSSTTESWDEKTEKKVYMRSDTTAQYSRSRHHGGSFLWFYAFRPYGSYSNGTYVRNGYYSRGLPVQANVGSNARKSSIVRGGFGGKSFRAAS